MTVGFALIFSTYIPNKPATMRWLDDRERAQLLHRLEMDRGTQDATDRMGTLQALRLSLTDVRIFAAESSPEQLNLYFVGITLFFCWVRF